MAACDISFEEMSQAALVALLHAAAQLNLGA
jgi:hypothetical protein|eukprot:SAG25_NODE_456_length_7858_cov_3.295657_3_plen_31_part_00